MAGSENEPFLSQADDPDDGPVPGTPGLPGPMGNPKSADPEVPDPEKLQRITGVSAAHSALIVAVLCYINLLNYMDRFTVAGTDCWGDRGGSGSRRGRCLADPIPSLLPRRPSGHRAVLRHRRQQLRPHPDR